jgi:HAD superfamily phosphatase
VDVMIVFDMDGVLTEVSESYREAIVQTVRHFTGQQITRDLIQEYKNQGGWNNDWALSQKIAVDLGVNVEYGDVVSRFNELFLGQNGEGLIRRERWFPQSGLLARLASSYELAIFTGRLRYEADISLKRFACDCRFDPIICSDDVANGKPAPDGLHSIVRMKPGRKLIFVGDTVDDARSASAAGVPFIGIAAESHSRREDLIRLFEQERAMAVIENINEIEGAL